MVILGMVYHMFFHILLFTYHPFAGLQVCHKELTAKELGRLTHRIMAELASGTFAHFPRCDQPLRHHIHHHINCNQLRNYEIPIDSLKFPSWKSN